VAPFRSARARRCPSAGARLRNAVAHGRSGDPVEDPSGVP
jgi:hypothetical protein